MGRGSRKLVPWRTLLGECLPSERFTHSADKPEKFPKRDKRFNANGWVDYCVLKCLEARLPRCPDRQSHSFATLIRHANSDAILKELNTTTRRRRLSRKQSCHIELSMDDFDCGLLLIICLLDDVQSTR